MRVVDIMPLFQSHVRIKVKLVGSDVCQDVASSLFNIVTQIVPISDSEVWIICKKEK